MLLVLLLTAAAAPGTTVTPFRTQVAPRVDAVFGDVASLRQAVDRFLALQGEMEQVRSEFSTSVHGTLAQLAAPAPGARAPRRCPPGALTHYGRALVAGGKYLALGRQLEARFREIRRADDLGDVAGLTPDYRAKIKRARELYLELLRDYREMRVAFHEQLGAELRHAGCDAGALAAASRPGAAALDPSDPTAWNLEDPSPEPPAAEPVAEGRGKAAPILGPTATAVWITIDNSHCPEKTTVSIDGAALGSVAGHKKVAVRARSGPHELCVLPASDKRSCGDQGTLRRAYLSEGWTLVVRCGK